jgi:hypothetical protein
VQGALTSGVLRAERRVLHGLGTAGAVLLAVVVGLLVQRGEAVTARIGGPLVFVVGIVALGVIAAVALVRPSLLVVAGFALSAAVRVEPAPVDLIFIVAFAMTVSTVARHVTVPPVVTIALGLFVPLSIVSSVNAVDGARALRFEAISLYLILVAVWLTGVFRDPVVTRRAAKAYVVAAAVSAIVALLALQVGFPGSSVFVYSGGQRAQGLFKDPNVFGPFLVPAFALVLEDVIRPRLLGWRQRTLVVLLALLGAGVVFAFSRGGWLNLALAAATIFVAYLGRRGGARFAWRGILALSVPAVAGLILLVATHQTSFLRERAKGQAYDQTRFSAQQEAFSHASRHVVGYGPGQVDVTLPASTHSIYARLVYEQGWIGLALLVLILGSTLLKAFTAARRDVDLHGVGSAALLGCWLGMIGNSFVVDTFHWRHLWMVAALIWALPKGTPAAARGPSIRLARPRAPRTKARSILA